MNTATALLRGPAVSAFLLRLNIDPLRFWLLIDLFDTLSKRGERNDQLGRNRAALSTAAIIYAVLSAVITAVLLASSASLATYIATFLGMTVFILLSILTLEAGNSLINPSEGLVLAHQPINGVTYVAAKLSHLLRIVLVFVAAVNLVPAFAGLLLGRARWYYPILHLTVALIVGMMVALSCCALFGWMVRFIPIKRLKAAAQLVGALPFFGIRWGQMAARSISRVALHYWAATPRPVAWSIGALLTLILTVGVVQGLRCLTADYLVRVSSLVRSGSSLGSKMKSTARQSLFASVIRRFFGGQNAVAGAAYVWRMMLRDWQFRRQLFPIFGYAAFGLISALTAGWPGDPFARAFTAVHFLPHALAFVMFFVCGVLPYGNDYQGSWIFLTVPSHALGGFARGIHGLMWIGFVLIPNLLAWPLMIWRWGFADATQFALYSLAAASMYLALEIGLIETIPFTKQVVTSRQTTILPRMMLGAVVAAIAVALQYYLLFHSRSAVAVATAVLAIASHFSTRRSVDSLATSMRLNLETPGHSKLFTEIHA
jgi:hypothetical protein